MTTKAAAAKPISERLFTTRVDLIDTLQSEGESHEALVASTKTRLHYEVLGMPLDNFIVRA